MKFSPLGMLGIVRFLQAIMYELSRYEIYQKCCLLTARTTSDDLLNREWKKLSLVGKKLARVHFFNWAQSRISKRRDVKNCQYFLFGPKCRYSYNKQLKISIHSFIIIPKTFPYFYLEP